MTLSSNSIIHFTRTKESLIGILKNNFKPHYCRERIHIGDDFREIYVPMVSFCDIPLSQIKDHITKYGSFGIGLTREWAVRQGLNPVLYIEKESELTKNFDYAHKKFVDEKEGDFEDLKKSEKCLADVLRYIKNYEADLNRDGNITTNYRFSDEREWRFVPNFNNKFGMFISESYLNNKENKKEVKKDKLRLGKLELSFEPNDIKYIIIENDDQISEFVDVLRKAKGKMYSYHDVERLMTILLTTEQIISDM